ncbi:MAG TPA: acyl carrier protein [Candidatus Wallbacteria bacterium]|nr:acyl carrier protein [Candidatus Wallbacteria bacterium]
MDIKAEVTKIVNKVIGKSSFLDVCFFDALVLSALKQIDYIQKTYEFKSSPLEFLEIKSVKQLYETVKKYSPGFSADFKSFCEAFYANFCPDILKNNTFTKDEASNAALKTKELSGLDFNVPQGFETNKITYSKIFSEIIKSVKASPQKLKYSESELMANLNGAIYSLYGEAVLNRGISLVNVSRRCKDVISFLTTLERVFKIKVNYAEVSSGDIFTNVYKLLREQRPDFNFNKAVVEQEIMAVAAKIFNDSNILLNLINAIEAKYKISLSKDDSIFAGSFEAFINVVSRAVKEQQPSVAAADVSLDVMTFASDFMSRQNIKVANPKLTNAIENKFISDIEKKFRVTFSVFDLLEITGLESTIKIVERLVKKQKINEKYPGLLPEAASELNLFVRREIIRTSRDNMIIGSEMMNTSMEGLDFPRKLDSMLSIEVVVQLEKNFKIKIPEEKLHAIKTIDDMSSLVEKLLEDKNRQAQLPSIETKDRL